RVYVARIVRAERTQGWDLDPQGLVVGGLSAGPGGEAVQLTRAVVAVQVAAVERRQALVADHVAAGDRASGVVAVHENGRHRVGGLLVLIEPCEPLVCRPAEVRAPAIAPRDHV